MSAQRILISGFLVLLFSAAGAFAQTPAQAPIKVVIIDTAVFFNETNGVTKIINATRALNTELATRRSEVTQIATRIAALNKEVEQLRSNVANGIPVDERTSKAKVDELESLKRSGKYKEDDFNALAQRRQNELVGPVYSDVLKTLGEWVKSKDYGIVFDVSKDQTGTLIFASEKHNITKEFITYYNARPVTAIAPVPR